MTGEPVLLSAYTTLRLGGPAGRFIEVTSDEELVAAVGEADEAGDSVLLLGGGSNLVVADAGFPGIVIRVATTGVTVREGSSLNGAGPDGAGPDGAGSVVVTVAAGESWDRLVERTVSERLTGIECLAGIPGLAGATPIQNVGAYGQEVARTIVAVRAFDRNIGEVVTLSSAQCEFGYRTSMLKQAAAGQATGRYIVLDVTFRLGRPPASGPALSTVWYDDLASSLGVAKGDQVPQEEARDAVLALRRERGMVLDPADPDTRSAGSFFTNPVLTAEQFAEVQRWTAEHCGPQTQVRQLPTDTDDGMVKVSAAWLIEQAGFTRGYGGGAARISSKHTLALINPGNADTAALLDLARQIMAGVRETFGVELTNEPVLVGVSL
jgi:UDP-N-acetylmuramate dehydrogenase